MNFFNKIFSKDKEVSLAGKNKIAVKYNDEFLDDVYYSYHTYVLYDDYLPDEHKYKKIIRYYAWGILRSNYKKWIVEVLDKKSMQDLNNLIFQETRNQLFPGVAGHASLEICVVFAAIACGDYATVESYYPHDMPSPFGGTTFSICATSLLMGIWYKDESIINNIKPKVEKYLKGKETLWYRTFLSYLYNLYKKNVKGMEDDIQLICKSYSRIDISDAEKKLCLCAHGLIILTYRIYPDIKITLPKYKNFSEEYIMWRLENINPTLELYFRYPEEMKGLNDVLLHPLTKTVLCQRLKDHTGYSTAIRKEWTVDRDQMIENFATEIIKSNKL